MGSFVRFGSGIVAIGKAVSEKITLKQYFQSLGKVKNADFVIFCRIEKGKTLKSIDFCYRPIARKFERNEEIVAATNKRF